MSVYQSPGLYTKETDFSFYVKQISTSACAMVGVAEKGPIGKATLVISWEQFVTKFGGFLANSYLAYAAKQFFDNGGQVLWVVRTAHYTTITDKTTLTALAATVTLKDRRPIKATLATGTVGTNRITWTAQTGGTAGNAITIALVVAGNDTPLSVAVVGNAITVNVATNGTGVATSTSAQVVAAIIASTPASALVLAASADTGVVAAVAATALSGGAAGGDTLKVTALTPGLHGNRLSVAIADSSKDPANRFNLIVKLDGTVVETFRDASMDEFGKEHIELQVNEKSEFIVVEDLNAMANTPDYRPAVTTSAALSAGDDGLASLADSDYIGDATSKTGIQALNEVDALNILCIPGVSSGAVITNALGWCELRKDVIFLADTPLGLEPQEVVDFRKGQGAYTSHAAFNSSYGGLYWPWVQVSDPITGKLKSIPPSGSVAGCYARSDQKVAVWAAPAGVDRGRIFGVVNLEYAASQGERDVLYPEGINVIASFPDTGVNIWGQKTLQSQASATDRVNVRRLMMFVEESVANSGKFVVFEPNLGRTWRQLERLINPFLQDIKDNEGVYDFRTQCDAETNTPVVQDRNELRCRVFVKPTKTAEFVEINFILTPTGGKFDELLAA